MIEKLGERAQIFARFVEAAAAERSYEFSARFDPIKSDFPVAPGKDGVVKLKRLGALIFQHLDCLRFVPMMLGREHSGAEDIKKSVHLGFYFIAKLADRMMQPGSELDRDVMFRGRENRARDLHRTWERVDRHTTGAKFVT